MSEEKAMDMENGHQLPLIQTFVALAVLTIIEVAVGYADSSPFVITVLMILALAKAVLVGAVFMEIAFDKQAVRIVLLVFVMPFIAILILYFVITADWRNVLVV